MATTNRHPNILWILTDEQRVDSLGCCGSAWARTPNLDALAARGVLFRNCFCLSPLCVPSRSAQLSCRYPQECNTLTNRNGPFPPGTVTFPEALAAAGYRTANIGKSHTPPHPTWQSSEDVRHFRHYAVTHSLADGHANETYRVVQDPKTQLVLAGTYPGGNDNPSRYVTDRGIEFIRSYDGATPFLLRVSHLWPHTPVLPPPPFDRLYTADDIPIRYFDEQATATRALHDRQMGTLFGLRDMDRATFARIWTDYMGLCAYVDYEVGRLLNELQKRGLSENTIVLFSTDHGRQLGEFGAAEKHTFDDIVWRVPFMVAWPGHLPAGAVRDDLCSLIDTGRTLTGLAGLRASVPALWRGRDLFDDPIPPEATQAAFGQIGFPDDRIEIARRGQEKNPAGHRIYGNTMRVGVRTRRYRMDVNWMAQGRRLDGEARDGNLFDMENDPLERRNLFNDPAHARVVEDLYNRLATWFEGLDKPDTLFPAAQKKD